MNYCIIFIQWVQFISYQTVLRVKGTTFSSNKTAHYLYQAKERETPARSVFQPHSTVLHCPQRLVKIP